MSKRMVGLVLLLAASVALGVVQGIWFFRLFEKTMPPLALSSFNQSAAHAMFLGYGVVSGGAIFLLALVAALVAPLFRGRAVLRPAAPARDRP